MNQALLKEVLSNMDIKTDGKSFYDVMQEISSRWNSMTEAQQKFIMIGLGIGK